MVFQLSDAEIRRIIAWLQVNDPKKASVVQYWWANHQIFDEAKRMCEGHITELLSPPAIQSGA